MSRTYARASTLFPALAAALLSMAMLAGCGGSQSNKSTAPEAPGDDEASGRHRAGAPDIGEEEDDGMQIEGLGGRLDVYHIRLGLEPHTAALNDCHASRQGKRKYIGGEIELAFVVHADGTVKSVRMIRSDLGAWPMEQCLLQVSRQIVFPKPEGNGEADFTVPLSFSGRGQLTAWDEAKAQAEVASKVAELAACATEAGVDEPQGVHITAYVGTRGQVQSVGFAAPKADIPEAWASCAEAKILAWSLADPMGKIAKLAFAYPQGAP